MPLVRLIILIFRGIGGFFRAIGRIFRALFSPGAFGFLVKAFEARCAGIFMRTDLS